MQDSIVFMLDVAEKELKKHMSGKRLGYAGLHNEIKNKLEYLGTMYGFEVES
jgi:hypothetical protein